MKLFIKIIYFLLLSFLILSCAKEENLKENNVVPLSGDTPENKYSEAIKDLEDGNFDIALIKFEEIKNTYPLSNEAIQSQIMSAFIEYSKMNYEQSTFILNKVISRYPSYKNIDYAFYMRALCYFEQIKESNLDGRNNNLALKNFQQIIDRFPESKYAKDSEQKILFIKENIAAKHMNIAMFYQNEKKYLASLKRYQVVIEEHSTSRFIPEALFRLVEIYYILGMLEDANKSAATLQYNYPDSEWNRFSLKIVGVKEEVSEENKESIIKKIIGILPDKNEKD